MDCRKQFQTIWILLLVGILVNGTVFGNFEKYIAPAIGAQETSRGLSGGPVNPSFFYWNPYALSQVPTLSALALATVSNTKSYVNIQGNIPFLNQPWGVGYMDVRRTKTTLLPTHHAGTFYLSSLHLLKNGFYLGGSGKFMNQTFGTSINSAFGLDIGGGYIPTETFSAGIMLHNIMRTESNPSSQQENSIQFTTSVGGRLGLFDNRLGVLGSFDIVENAPNRYHGGLSYQLNNWLEMNAGYDHGDFTLGTGINHENWLLGFSWSDLNHSKGEDIYHVSVGYLLEGLREYVPKLKPTVYLSAENQLTHFNFNHKKFVDIPLKYWARDDISALTYYGLMVGPFLKPESKNGLGAYFEPNKIISRAEAAKIIVLATQFHERLKRSKVPIHYDIKDQEKSEVYETRLVILDDSDNEVKTILDSVSQKPGSYNNLWDGTDNQGNKVPEGLYHILLKVDYHKETVSITQKVQVNESETVLLISHDRKTIFEDVPDTHWAKDYVNEAVNMTIFNNSAYHFYPDEPISKIDFIVGITNALKYLGASSHADVDLTYYRDHQNIPAYAETDMNVYVTSLQYGGNERRELEPLKNIPRAESVAIANRLMNWEGPILDPKERLWVHLATPKVLLDFDQIKTTDPPFNALESDELDHVFTVKEGANLLVNVVPYQDFQAIKLPIQFSIKKMDPNTTYKVEVMIKDRYGRTIKTLYENPSYYPGDHHTVYWDGTNKENKKVLNGDYHVKLFITTEKSTYVTFNKIHVYRSFESLNSSNGFIKQTLNRDTKVALKLGLFNMVNTHMFGDETPLRKIDFITAIGSSIQNMGYSGKVIDLTYYLDHHKIPSDSRYALYTYINYLGYADKGTRILDPLAPLTYKEAIEIYNQFLDKAYE
ncbi:MAG: S-layer homology domain-containing protein [Candidatus Margulisbacteria bacterium]|nr:S-layer homology domain-containing protein [Candidatus Margulisiibacteriota bacterium]